MIMKSNDNGNMNKQKIYLRSGAILKFLLGSGKMEDLILCKSSEYDFVTSDQDLYEALGSLKEYDDFNQRKIVKLLEVADVVPYRNVSSQKRKILTHERVEAIRKIALKENGE